jgi:glycosyltransferase involved in cell wall biosynthesis
MGSPRVSFVIPCYKLAHLLPECVGSILRQTYGDLEVLVMDDCSPDDTVEVAHSFSDSRVRHVRNDHNLGHLRNYNKGIEIARGEYIWLISADDYLRRPYVLERYLEVLDQTRDVGYAFCSGVGVRNGSETGVVNWSTWGARDLIIPGHSALRTLLEGNRVLAPSALVRRECYDRAGAFPLDMPWAGDWYLWCLFALHWRVAYFAEPMVCYREHDLSLTTQRAAEVEARRAEEILLRWRIKRKADEAHFKALSRLCLRKIAGEYRTCVSRPYGGPRSSVRSVMSLHQFEDSLCSNTSDQEERDCIRAQVHVELGADEYCRGDRRAARQQFEHALRINPRMVKAWAWKVLLSLGPAGDALYRLKRSSAVASGRP